jgi:hypothetical protein
MLHQAGNVLMKTDHLLLEMPLLDLQPALAQFDPQGVRIAET